MVQAGRDLGLPWPIVQRCLEDYAAKVLSEDLPATSAIGIDETRRGKPAWKQNPSTGKWELVADAWHIGFVDAIGGRSLFGQVEGRNAASVADRLTSQPASWREQVRYVAIDLCATFRAAVSPGSSTAAGPARATASTPSANSCAGTRKTSPRINAPYSRSSWITHHSAKPTGGAPLNSKNLVVGPPPG
ncbi:hypothetical protein ABT150_28370 [Streptomyces mirabilis]|uniref:hypothetical protein n=1 Tax=Streptomyces mirabilis TaxID=68239 RepID=UPI00332AD46F